MNDNHFNHKALEEFKAYLQKELLECLMRNEIQQHEYSKYKDAINEIKRHELTIDYMANLLEIEDD
jgi:hypothetical protein